MNARYSVVRRLMPLHLFKDNVVVACVTNIEAVRAVIRLCDEPLLVLDHQFRTHGAWIDPTTEAPVKGWGV